ncbi:MAG: tRNA (adenosine(37)-N6)-dimethylallyltransferase MiaA [bacterium]
MNNPIIVLTGPTASGKTAFSYEIAKIFTNIEIICADSMTVYTGMDIGTDKPTSIIQNTKNKKQNEEGSYVINNIPHHLLDIVNPDEEFNVAIFIKKVTTLVKEIHDRGNIPMLVGGSVMYIDAFAYSYSMPDVKPNIELRYELEKKNTDELFNQLCEFDPDCEWTVDRHNKRRLIREIEVFLATGQPISKQKQRSPLPNNILYLAVDREREILYEQINKRVDIMFLEGFVEEVRNLHRLYDHNTAMQAAGYKQICQYLDGDIDLVTAIAKTKQAHRNYAKRQLTWLRRNKDIKWIANVKEATISINGLII